MNLFKLAKSICRIRWTPDVSRMHASACYAWIIGGLALVRGVEVIEVFPTASWTRWHGKRGSRTRSAWTRQGLAALGLDGVPARTNQDERDAIAAAMTARQHTLAMTETMGDIVVRAGHWCPAGSQSRGLVSEVPGEAVQARLSHSHSICYDNLRGRSHWVSCRLQTAVRFCRRRCAVSRPTILPMSVVCVGCALGTFASAVIFERGPRWCV